MKQPLGEGFWGGVFPWTAFLFIVIEVGFGPS